ncbi:hypothetical protein CDV36_005610 [Fusarium kuroshium]|uniref:Major facilitator superfamily (MFS) profile domain-containing protein n=1 Tax=Fusarium kuroshium TaxID=2010991 RepID=A0A3M2SB04_9HYPO|nr:hypothetical protein CDV36_005610 [Fusarium kuroshium]
MGFQHTEDGGRPSMGIGEATAKLLAEHGVNIALVSRSKDKLENVRGEITSKFPDVKVAVYPVDIQDQNQVESAVKSAISDLGQIDILINNAGLALGAPARFWELPIDQVAQMSGTNINAVMFTTHAVLNLSMWPRKKGKILNVSSVTGLECPPFNGEAVCHASKAFLEGFTNSLRMETAGSDIRVLTLRPGCVDTRFHLQRVKYDQDAMDEFFEGYEPLAAEDLAQTVLGKSLQFGITVCCLAAFILFGYEQGVFGPILQNQDWLELFNRPSDSQTGIIVACYNLGCMINVSIVAFVVGERTGRRRAIWIAMTFVVIGTTLQATSFHLAHLVVGRIITGVGTGLKTTTVPMYQSELCTPTSRGRLVSAEVLFVGVGIVFAYWFNFGMSFVGGPIAWRLPIALQALFAVLVIILVFALPESPRWLFNHGREAEAIETLCAVYDMQPTDEFIQSERAAILQAIEAETGGTIFKRDKNRTGYRVFLAWLIQLVNQISGINMVVYYIPTVLEENVGMTVQRSQIIGGCIQMMFMFGSILPSLALDRMGRRKTMLWGCFGLGTCMLFISALLSQSDGGKTDRGLSFASASVAFFFLYQLIFGMSVNCVPWVYVPELLPLEARTKGSAIGWNAYLIFMATNYAFIPMIYILFPETSNLRLEDIDQIFSTGGDPVKVARRIKADARTGAALDAEMGNESKDTGEIETVEKANGWYR